ncbi:class I SAM-dependent methyltransferase [Patescibacteria group bacterium]|nr:class I SAM-dependent methyltransferase [Patescibacteria group bacterium]
MKLKYNHFNIVPFETHMLVYDKIKTGSKVLDAGCASGYFARELKKKNCKVWGIDSDKNAIRQAKRYCVDTFAADVETLSSIPFRQKYDYILLLDVIEHLKNPNHILQTAKKYLNTKGEIIISTPNIAFLSSRLSHFAGKFEYRDTGIMDNNHIHFYTKKSLIDLIKRNGLKLKTFDTASGFSQISWFGHYLNHIPKIWQYKITRLFDTLLAYQFIAFCNS